jgi:hypothetical protein
MKTGIITSFLAVCIAMIYGCTSLTKCDSMTEREAIILADVSDPRLYKEIENDLSQNFPGFAERNRLGSISPCQRFTLTISHLSGKEALELSNESIAIERKGQSRDAEKKQASPKPLVNLLQKKLSDYRLLSEQADMTARSNIANTLFKAINLCNHEKKNVILVFSDMVENNKLINFYKKIPSENEMQEVIGKMIEPNVLEEFKRIQEQGLNVCIIIVLKPEPSNKTSVREIKTFWTAFFKELKLDGQTQFIDNLTNPVSL